MLFEQQQFIYDNNGNQLQTIRTTYTGGIPGAPVITQQNTYDLRNQLIRTVTENGTIVENVYNGDGLRVEKIVNGTATFYLYEYQRVVLEQNSLGDVTGRNVYGTNLLMRTVGADAFFYMYNAHADVTALLSTSGTIIGTYYYDAFGNILEQTGSAGNSILFAGYQYDKETGMYYLNARMYDPVTARFMQEDTYTGQYNDPLSLNLYTYCHNEPLMYSDPTGHEYVYHGQSLSEDSGSDNMAQRAQRQAMEREYSGNPVSNAAEAAMVSAGYGTAADKAPTMTHSLTTVTEEYRTAQDVAYDLYIEMYLGTSGSGSLEGSEVLLNALVSSTLDNATNREIRNDTIANMIAMDKNSLTPDNIEQAVLKNKVIAGMIAQEQDIKDADPTFEGFLKDCNEHPEPFIIGGTAISLLLAIPTGGASMGAFQGAMLGGGLTLGTVGISDYGDNGTIDLKGTDYLKQWLGGAAFGGITGGALGASTGLSAYQQMAFVGASSGIGNGAYQYITTGKVDSIEMLNNAIGGAIVVGATDLVSKGISSLAKCIKKAITPKTTQTVQTVTDMSTGVSTAECIEASPQEGSFSIANWDNYPTNIPRPEGPFRVIEGEEYDIARKLANQANSAMHSADPSLAGMQMHEIQPVKFGGDPVGITNKIALNPKDHAQLTTWWRRLLKTIQG